jgi:Beta-lactamase
MLCAALMVLTQAARPDAGVAADIACDPNGCISISALAKNITATLHNHVVGFVAIVGGLPAIFQGQARTAADPPKTAMLPDLPINIASVTKVLTTVAVLQSLDRHHLTLDTKIWPYLYKDWKRGANIDTITFRMLLSHAAGFRWGCGGSNTTYAVLKAQIAAGVKKSDMVDSSGNPVHSYNNCNFAIFRELLPQMEGFPIIGPTDAFRAMQSAAFYITYMNQHVFRPVGVPQRACRAPKTSNDIPGYRFPAALTYPDPPNSAHGDDWGDWTLACGGGGWVLSAGDLFDVVKDLANGTALVTKAEKSELMAPAPNCIGWDCSVRNDCPDPSLCKNGGLDNGAIVLHTYAGILKCNVPVVVIVNSVLPAPYETGSDIIGVVHDAQTNAKVTTVPPRACP